MQLHQVKWRDFESVLAYAMHLQRRAPTVTFYMYWDSDERQYKLTHRREKCGSHRIIVFITGGDGGKE